MRIVYCLFFTCFSMIAKGQNYHRGEKVQAITHKIVIPPDGSMEEVLALTQEWTEHVLRKHENFESIQLLLSDSGKDTVDLMVLYHYASNQTRNTNEVMQELIKVHWPKEEDFKEFMSRLHSYIDPIRNRRSMYRELILK